jgi:hypothetical protein
VCAPSSVVTVIVTFPPDSIPFISPVVALIIAIEGLLLTHVTFLLVAEEGNMVAVSVSVSSSSMVIVLLNLTLSTDVGTTVTTQVAVRAPSAEVAVMVAVPTDTPVTLPAATVATSMLLLVHVMLLFVASLGSKVTTSLVAVWVACSSNVVSSNAMLLTLTGLSSLEHAVSAAIKSVAKSMEVIFLICFIFISIIHFY